ncbi:MAG: response regulator [Cyclobacteriaceae bacterium]
MNKLYLLCIDDQPEVLNALESDLSEFEEYLNIEICESGEEALELIEDIDQQGDHLAVVISDQVMPEMTGVDVLRTIQNDRRFTHTQKILLTGLATHQDTIQAINTGGLDHYIQKPWTKEGISLVIRKSLTSFIVEKGLEYEPYLEVLDQPMLYEALRNRS